MWKQTEMLREQLRIEWEKEWYKEMKRKQEEEEREQEKRRLELERQEEIRRQQFELMKEEQRKEWEREQQERLKRKREEEAKEEERKWLKQIEYEELQREQFELMKEQQRKEWNRELQEKLRKQQNEEERKQLEKELKENAMKAYEEQAKAEFWKKRELERQMQAQIEEDTRKRQLKEEQEEIQKQRSEKEKAKYRKQLEDKEREQQSERIAQEEDETHTLGQKYLLELQQFYHEYMQEELSRSQNQEVMEEIKSIKFATEPQRTDSGLGKATSFCDQEKDMQKEPCFGAIYKEPRLERTKSLSLDDSEGQDGNNSFTAVLDRDIAEMERRLSLIGMIESTPRPQAKSEPHTFIRSGVDSEARQKGFEDKSLRRQYNVSEKEQELKGREIHEAYEDTKPKEFYYSELAGSTKSVMPNVNLENMAQVGLADNIDRQMAYYYQGYKKALEEVKRVLPVEMNRPQMQGLTGHYKKDGESKQEYGKRGITHQYERQEVCKPDQEHDNKVF